MTIYFLHKQNLWILTKYINLKNVLVPKANQDNSSVERGAAFLTAACRF